ncbi:FecR family protein [Mangrovibacterium sp.]|uniref:FecR family protein n=1 Tax=Mangrovibacterium sp. TaxID=1961364 RepID=UPI00356A8A0B
MTKELLKKFLNNNCTEAELNEVLQWVKTSALSDQGKQFGFDDWNNYLEEGSFGNDEKFATLFDQIQEQIDDKAREEKQIKRIQFSSIKTWLTQAAAILLIPVLGILFYTLSERKTELAQYAGMTVDSLEIVAPVGSRTIVQLSDGSVVHLNSGSKLKYPQFFTSKTRDVKLTGEGYFEVAHNPEKPFIVHAGELNIKALGTEFNVLAYPDTEVFETTLINGKVVLEQGVGNNKTKTISAMEPGQHVQYNIRTDEVSSSFENVEKFIAWRDGKLMFIDTPIGEVAEKLSRMFNVDILVDKDIEDYIYTVTFLDEPLFQILDLMAIATPIDYKSLPRKKLTDGRYTKQKIIISRK